MFPFIEIFMNYGQKVKNTESEHLIATDKHFIIVPKGKVLQQILISSSK